MSRVTFALLAVSLYSTSLMAAPNNMSVMMDGGGGESGPCACNDDSCWRSAWTLTYDKEVPKYVGVSDMENYILPAWSENEKNMEKVFEIYGEDKAKWPEDEEIRKKLEEVVTQKKRIENLKSFMDWRKAQADSGVIVSNGKVQSASAASGTRACTPEDIQQVKNEFPDPGESAQCPDCERSAATAPVIESLLASADTPPGEKDGEVGKESVGGGQMKGDFGTNSNALNPVGGGRTTGLPNGAIPPRPTYSSLGDTSKLNNFTQLAKGPNFNAGKAGQFVSGSFQGTDGNDRDDQPVMMASADGFGGIGGFKDNLKTNLGRAVSREASGLKGSVVKKAGEESEMVDTDSKEGLDKKAEAQARQCFSYLGKETATANAEEIIECSDVLAQGAQNLHPIAELMYEKSKDAAMKAVEYILGKGADAPDSI